MKLRIVTVRRTQVPAPGGLQYIDDVKVEIPAVAALRERIKVAVHALKTALRRRG